MASRRLEFAQQDGTTGWLDYDPTRSGHRRPSPTVLFVCVHNAVRSQMAAGYLQHLAGDRVNVLAASSQPADAINPVAVQAMGEEGIDIAANQPKVLTEARCRPRTSSSPWAAGWVPVLPRKAV